MAANALLGVNQSLALSMTVIMKIDLVGLTAAGLFEIRVVETEKEFCALATKP